MATMLQSSGRTQMTVTWTRLHASMVTISTKKLQMSRLVRGKDHLPAGAKQTSVLKLLVLYDSDKTMATGPTMTPFPGGSSKHPIFVYLVVEQFSNTLCPPGRSHQFHLLVTFRGLLSVSSQPKKPIGRYN